MWTVRGLFLLVVWLGGMSALAQSGTGRPDIMPVQSGRPLSDPLDSDLFRTDAQLNDVCFVDAEHGWAVGDRGAIWATLDGGRNWQLQASGARCPLYGVHFVDAQTGWAVGGSSHPYTHTSTGVVLATRDGGRRWQSIPNPLAPTFKRVQFADARHGWAVGCSSPMFPAGVFTTDSGGRNWQPLPGENSGGWLAAAFLDPLTGVLAGRSSKVSVVQKGNIEPSKTASFGLRSLNNVSLVPPLYGWLVGDGGLVMLTGDLGVTWQTPPSVPPSDVAGQFDWIALCVRGPKCWIAGAPGTRVLHTADAGRSWQVFSTGQHVPIRAISMVDDERGWAVGALGTILTTSDGGQSWQRQRAGGTRTALLGLFSTPDQVPLELLARLSGNEGYLSAVEVLTRRDVESRPRDGVPQADRLHEAVVGVGGSTSVAAWQFPLRQAGLSLSAQQVVAGWDTANDGRGLPFLKAHLVRQIRQWRPEVIVTDDPQSPNDPVRQILGQAVLEAVTQAADPTVEAEQISLAGLEPWQVKKVFARLPDGVRGAPDLVTSQLAARLGRTLADLTALPRAYLDDQFRASPGTIGFRQIGGPASDEPQREDFFRGIVLHPGGEARRELPEAAPETAELLARLAQRRRNTQAIFERVDKDAQGGTGWAAQTVELTRQLDPDGAAWVLYNLANRYQQRGQWDLAADTFQMLADRYPDHPLRRAAILWLVQVYASSEVAWRVRGGQRYDTGQASTLAVTPGRQEDRPGRAAALGNVLEQHEPALFSEPALRFPLAAAHRQQGFGRQAERYFLMLSKGANRDAWWAAADSERWLAEPSKGVPPKSVLRCVTAGVKPRLDGKLDDPVWRVAPPAVLRSTLADDAEWPGQVQLAYDKQFLYVAIACRQAPQAKYEPTSAVRRRDADLSSRDRVDLFLDLDRDFVTSYRLAIDYRGWTNDSCCGDRTWDPQWFVSARADDGLWTAEAAIPLDQLTGRYPAPRDVWAVGLQRIVPGVGFQSWTTPASVDGTPEGFGYLIFE